MRTSSKQLVESLVPSLLPPPAFDSLPAPDSHRQGSSRGCLARLQSTQSLHTPRTRTLAVHRCRSDSSATLPLAPSLLHMTDTPAQKRGVDDGRQRPLQLRLYLATLQLRPFECPVDLPDLPGPITTFTCCAVSFLPASESWNDERSTSTASLPLIIPATPLGHLSLHAVVMLVLEAPLYTFLDPAFRAWSSQSRHRVLSTVQSAIGSGGPSILIASFELTLSIPVLCCPSLPLVLAPINLSRQPSWSF